MSASCQYEHVLSVAVQGKRVVSFFNIANRPVNNVIASDKLMAGSEKLSVADKIKKLKGQRVAMPSANGSGEKMLGVLAKKYGLTLPGDISTASISAPRRRLTSRPSRKTSSMPRCRSSRRACWCSSRARARSIST